MRLRVRTQLTWLALGIALHLPPLWVVDAQPTDLIALSGEWCVVVALAAWMRERVGVAAALALAWTTLFSLELMRTAGRLLTAADPQLYDLLFLVEHLVILVSDLWGLPVLLGGGVLLVAALAALVVGLARLLGPVPGAPETRRVATAAALAAVVLAPLPGQLGARWVAPEWVANISESVETWRATHQSITRDPYAALRSRAPAQRPDVHLYVVESYGRTLDSTKSLHDPYHDLLAELAPGVEAQGLHVASGWASATVSGGRSWISDASVLLGVGIGHQSTWAHLQPHTDRFTHLPAWLAAHGYTTVVCRPKDRARLGIEVRNDFDWDRTVFADDIEYEGTLMGWGGIPDQYSLGWLHHRVLPATPGPQLLFFHGVSAHGPWTEVPRLAPTWIDARNQQGDGTLASDMDARHTVLRQAKRFGDKLDEGGARLPGRRFPELRRGYFDAIDYSLRATLGALADLPGDRGHLVVVYGDHQPPFIARKGDFDVPVHILASDPSWLEPFLTAGFRPGLAPDGASAAVPITALYPLLAESLVGAPLEDIPRGVELGAVATASGDE